MVVISFSIIVSCIFISLLLVTVRIVYIRAGSSISVAICTLCDGENISFDASLVMYTNNTNIPPIMIMNRTYENQNLLYIVARLLFIDRQLLLRPHLTQHREHDLSNSVALVRKRTIPTERPPPVSEVSANFCG